MQTHPANPSQLRHDIRGCINSIRLSVEVLKTQDGKDCSEFFAGIETELATADMLLEGLTRPTPATQPVA